jgi:hypothetical protein
MTSKQSAQILHGLACIENTIDEAIELQTLETNIDSKKLGACCIDALKRLKKDIEYGVRVIKEVSKWTLP